jgi:hypothetical protein
MAHISQRRERIVIRRVFVGRRAYLKNGSIEIRRLMKDIILQFIWKSPI